MYFKNEGEIKTFPRCAKGERIYHQPTCITRNVKKKENYIKWKPGFIQRNEEHQKQYLCGQM